jgi:hypothetical protein
MVLSDNILNRIDYSIDKITTTGNSIVVRHLNKLEYEITVPRLSDEDVTFDYRSYCVLPKGVLPSKEFSDTIGNVWDRVSDERYYRPKVPNFTMNLVGNPVSNSWTHDDTVFTEYQKSLIYPDLEDWHRFAEGTTIGTTSHTTNNGTIFTRLRERMSVPKIKSDGRPTVNHLVKNYNFDGIAPLDKVDSGEDYESPPVPEFIRDGNTDFCIYLDNYVFIVETDYGSVPSETKLTITKRYLDGTIIKVIELADIEWLYNYVHKVKLYNSNSNLVLKQPTIGVHNARVYVYIHKSLWNEEGGFPNLIGSGNHNIMLEFDFDLHYMDTIVHPVFMSLDTPNSRGHDIYTIKAQRDGFYMYLTYEIATDKSNMYTPNCNDTHKRKINPLKCIASENGVNIDFPIRFSELNNYSEPYIDKTNFTDNRGYLFANYTVVTSNPLYTYKWYIDNRLVDIAFANYQFSLLPLGTTTYIINNHIEGTTNHRGMIMHNTLEVIDSEFREIKVEIHLFGTLKYTLYASGGYATSSEI